MGTSRLKMSASEQIDPRTLVCMWKRCHVHKQYHPNLYLTHTFFFSPPSVCPMGSSSSSNGRLFGTLAQSLTSAPLEQTEPYLEKKLGQDLALDQDLVLDLVETDPELLLRECEEALQRRPARPQRDLVYLNCMAPCRRKHSTSIRIMQWNILAQGRWSQLVDIRAFSSVWKCLRCIILWHECIWFLTKFVTLYFLLTSFELYWIFGILAY